jgi:uncharacterized DUF497 family protein
MKFEWDPEKSAANKAKHKIDFETAKSLWNDPDRIEILAPFSTRKSDDSDRSVRKSALVSGLYHETRIRSDHLRSEVQETRGKII